MQRIGGITHTHSVGVFKGPCTCPLTLEMKKLYSFLMWKKYAKIWTLLKMYTSIVYPFRFLNTPLCTNALPYFDLTCLCPIHTADADATKLSNCVASAVWTQFATSSRRLPTDSIDNLETGQTDSISLTTWIFIDIDNFFNNDDIMT